MTGEHGDRRAASTAGPGKLAARRWWVLPGSLAALGLLLVLLPYGLGAYHLEMGGRALDRAIAAPATGAADLFRATDHLDAALRWHAGNAQAYWLLGQAHHLQGDLASVVQDLDRYTELNPRNPRGWWALARTYQSLGMVEAAVSAWQAGGFTGQDCLAAGETARAAGRFQEALRWYECVTWIEPSSGEPWYYIGRAYQGLEQWEDAWSAFEFGLGLELAADGPGPGDFLHEIGLLKAQKLDPPSLEGALATFDAALADDRFFSEDQRFRTHYDRAEVLLQLGRDREAMLEFEWVVEQQPDHYWGLVNLGRLYWQVEGDFPLAEVMLLRAAALQPDVKWAYHGLTRIYQDTGRIDQAVEMCRRVLDIDPQDELARSRLQELTGEGDG